LLAVAEGAALKPELNGEAFNIVPNEAFTVQEIVRFVQAAVGSGKDPIVERPEAHFECEHLDNSKARWLLGWTPKYSMPDALAETVAWYREHGTAGSH
jgi:nucleoside-diphosphate-sugar epimerase